ncbi:hypothetical protein GBF38_019037 [Nibea albiflora]|uniref:Uncharacterized protein n=1 Tax=Nibea albiflora TaxID=240163 RepID=A0ACB7F592_NIBAL|nr:hypothetical protein GBF38_019037 [Nibea albiflora]
MREEETRKGEKRCEGRGEKEKKEGGERRRSYLRSGCGEDLLNLFKDLHNLELTQGPLEHLDPLQGLYNHPKCISNLPEDLSTTIKDHWNFFMDIYKLLKYAQQSAASMDMMAEEQRVKRTLTEEAKKRKGESERARSRRTRVNLGLTFSG